MRRESWARVKAAVRSYWIWSRGMEDLKQTLYIADHEWYDMTTHFVDEGNVKW